jgi:nucleoside-diphosphate-sugar epimerase
VINTVFWRNRVFLSSEFLALCPVKGLNHDIINLDRWLSVLKGKKILVSGASGFVGLSLALELAKTNEVHGLARFQDESIRRLLENAGVIIIVKDVMKQGLDDVPTDYVYVFSELAMLRNCDPFPKEAFLVNTRFVGDLVEHSRSADGVVLASTGAVYRPSPEAWKEDGPLDPRSTYALTKLCGEVLGSYVSEKLNVPICVLRYFYPFGPLSSGGILARWADAIREGTAIPLKRSAIPLYNPHFISDCVELTIEATKLSGVPATIMNVAGVEIKSKTEFLDMISEALGMNYRVEGSEKEELAWVGDVSLMLKSLGEPKVKLKEGIERMVNQRYGSKA